MSLTPGAPDPEGSDPSGHDFDAARPQSGQPGPFGDPRIDPQVGHVGPSDAVGPPAAAGPPAHATPTGPAHTQPRHTVLRPQRRPIATYILIGVTVAVYLAQLLAGRIVIDILGFAPIDAAHQPWRALTTAFVHAQGNLTHIAFNMLGLLLFGRFLEHVLGPVRFLALYLVSALGGSLAVLLIAVLTGGLDDLLTVHIGASGAVFGLLGFIAVPTRQLDRNISGVIGFIVVNLVLVWLLPAISWQAHLGGFLTGLLLGCGFLLVPRSRRSLAFWVLAVAVVLSVAAIFAALDPAAQPVLT